MPNKDYTVISEDMGAIVRDEEELVRRGEVGGLGEGVWGKQAQR